MLTLSVAPNFGISDIGCILVTEQPLVPFAASVSPERTASPSALCGAATRTTRPNKCSKVGCAEVLPQRPEYCREYVK